MKLVLIIFFFAVIANAGSTSQWTEPFTLTDVQTAIQNGKITRLTSNGYSLTILIGRSSREIRFSFGQAYSLQNSTLKLYRVSGVMVADLSGLIHGGGKTVAWRGQGLASGLYFATLKNGNIIKSVKFVLSR